MKVYAIMGITHLSQRFMDDSYDLIAIMSSIEGAFEYVNTHIKKLREEFGYDNIITIEKNLDDVLTF